MRRDGGDAGAGPGPPRRVRRRGRPVRRGVRGRARCRRSWPSWPPPRTEERGLTPGEVEVVDGAVQILTVHAAKGLEWDVVAVAGLRRGRVPGQAEGEPTTSSRAWACCRSRCAATPTACPRSTLPSAGDAEGRCATRSRRSRGVAGAPRAGGAAAGVRGGDPAAAPAALLRVLVGRGLSRAARAVGLPRRDPRRRACAGAGPWSTWAAAAGRTTRRTRRWPRRSPREWPVDPLGATGAPRSRPERGPGARGTRPAGPRAERGRATQARQWALEAELLLAERDRLRAGRDGRGGAARAPVGVAAGRAAPRPAAAGPAAAPADAGGARPVRPPGHRVPPLAGAAVRRRASCSTWTSCPAPATTGAAPDAELARAAGAVPGQRVGRPVRRTGWRCRSRPWSPASWSGAGWTPCSTVPGRPGHFDVIDWKTGRKPTGADADRGRGAARRVPAGLGRAGRRAGGAGRGRRSTTCATRDRPPGRPARRGRLWSRWWRPSRRAGLDP